MKKIAIVAGSELGMLVRTKAFIVTVLLMPVLVGGSLIVQTLVAKQVDRTPRRFAVIDHTGVLYAPLARAAEQRNALVASGVEKGAPFEPVRSEPRAEPEAELLRFELSERIRADDIFAFVEIPEDALDQVGLGVLQYHSDRPTYEDLRKWIEHELNAAIAAERLRRAHVDPDLVARLARSVPSLHSGLYQRNADGTIAPAAVVDPVTTYVVPLVIMYILFLTIFMSAPQLMNAVMQEKLSRISEVLLGSISPFELMMGKLLGGAGTSLVLALVYLGGGVIVALHSGYGYVITPGLIGLFLLFLVLAVLLYGSVFIAVGAACSELKDAQSLITPVMLVAVLPMFALQAVLKSPGSAFSTVASLVPTATPFLMQLRLALHPGPPAWQVALGLALTAAMTFGCVWAAGKIFRVGILAQGKSAGLGEMLRWLRVK